MTAEQVALDLTGPGGLRHVDVPHGRAGLDALVGHLAAIKATDPLEPVTVVVPTNVAGVTVRRHLGRVGNGVIGLQVLTLRRLAELLGGPALVAGGRLPVSTPVIAAAVRAELAADPGVFRAVADHPSTLTSLVRVHRELRDVAPDLLDVLAATTSRAGDVVGLHRRVHARLATRFHDEMDLLDAAADAVGASPVTDELGGVVLFWPQRLTLAGARLLQRLADHRPVDVLTSRTGHEDADRDIRRVLQRLGVDGGEAPVDHVPGPLRVITTSDQDEECRHAVDVVVDAIRRGTPPGRIAVLHPQDVPYARLLDDALVAADVPVNGPGPRSVLDHHVGRWLLDLLDEVDGDRRRAAVVSLLAASQAAVSGTHRGGPASWQRHSREAGVVAGSAQWHDRLARQRSRLEARERSTASLDGLSSAVAELFLTLDRVAAATTWTELATACRAAVTDWLGHPEERTGWPSEEADAADRVEAALDRLEVLDLVDAPMTVRDARRVLELEFEDARPRRGRLGRGVHVGPLHGAVGMDLDLVVVVGATEGVLPSSPRQDSLLLDEERAVVAVDLPARRDRVGTQRRQLHMALCAAPERVVLAPRGDLRTNAERVLCRWVAELVPPSSVEVAPSHAHRIVRSGAVSTPQAARLRSLSSVDLRDPDVDPPAGDPTLTRGVELVRARRGPWFGRFDGNVAAVADLLPSRTGDDLVYPTRLEAWVACPHSALVGQVLEVRAVENPEERLTLSPMETGILVHDVLEDWLREQLATPPAPHESWSDAARVRLREIAEERLDAAEATGLTGHDLLWRRDRRRLLATFDRFVDQDDERRRELRVHPVAAEAEIGGDELAPLRLDLGDGRVVTLGGKVDRVDRDLAGGLVVTDYKTGKVYPEHRALADPEADPVGAGTRLQLAVYALGVAGVDARDVRAEYWFTSDRGEWQRLGYVVDDRVVDRLVDVVRRQVDLWAAGAFPAHPDPPDDGKPWVSCDVCDPDALGTADLHRRFERLVAGGELAGFVELHHSWEVERD